MRVATLEMDIGAGDLEGNLGTALRGLRAAAAAGAELVALPEMWSTGFTPGSSEAEIACAERALGAIAVASQELDIAVIGSGPAPSGAGGPPANRAHVIVRGQLAGGYDKVHLFSPTAEPLAFTAGDAPPAPVALPRSGARVAPIVCYDLRFPAISRSAFRAGADVFVVVAQWPEARAAHWGALLRGRAAECQAHVIGCNRIGEDEVGRRRVRLRFTGGSAVIGPGGVDVRAAERREIDGGTRRSAALSIHDIDLAESRRLRREVPVARDERRDLYPGWIE
jgi:predicted amidohydrolase